MRWAWIGLAIVSTIGYLWMNPLIVLVWSQDEEEGRKESVENLEGDGEVDAEDVLLDTGVEDDSVAGVHTV